MSTFLFLLAAAAAQPAPEPLKTFRDWTVGCDNGRACQAVALVPEDKWDDYVPMSVRRGADPGAVPEISFEMRGEAEPAWVLLGGKRVPVRTLLTDGGPRIGSEAVPAILAAARTADRLELLAKDGKAMGTVSLAGASAALLYMDEQQKRLGSTTALVRPGSKPSSTVPPPPTLPRVVSAAASAKAPRRLSKAEVQRLRKDGCDDVEIEESEEAAAEMFRLDARMTVALIPLRCWSGAYNMASRLLVAGDAGAWKNARFDHPLEQGAEDPDTGIVYNAEWDPKARRLGTYIKGRGLGDCGTVQTYAWDGTRFRLVEQAEMGECRGSMDYITTWRAQVVSR
jgi:hypothetical protein